MVDKTHPPLWIRPAVSRQLKAYLFLTHGLALIALPLSGLAVSLQLLVLAGVCLSLAHNWRSRVLYQGSSGLRQLCWEPDGQWLLQNGRGEWQRVRSYQGVWIHPKVILLRFGKGWRTPSGLLLMADAVSPNLHRQLRVRLTLHPCSRDSAEGT